MITTRPMTRADDAVVSRIMSECYRLISPPDGLTGTQLDRMLSERCRPEHAAMNRTRFTCYVAEFEDSIAGFVAISENRIEELAVSPKHHRRGIATALFHIAENSCQGPRLMVGTTGYGVPFYEAMGMRMTGKRLVTFGPLEGRELIQLEKTTEHGRPGQPFSPGAKTSSHG